MTHTAAASAIELSPDASRVAFRRDHDLYTLDVVSLKETRLTHDGSPTWLNGELDWVLSGRARSEHGLLGVRPIRAHRRTCIRREPRARIPQVGPAPSESQF